MNNMRNFKPLYLAGSERYRRRTREGTRTEGEWGKWERRDPVGERVVGLFQQRHTLLCN